MRKLWPERWRPTRLKHESSLKGRLGWQGLKADEYRDEGPHVVSSAHFERQRVLWDLCPRVSMERYLLDENIQLAPRDILLMKDGAALGKLAYLETLPGPACLNSHLLLLRPIDSAYDPRFMFHVTTTDVFQDYMQVYGTGATFMGVSQRDIGNFTLSLPPLEEQTQIARFLDYETAKIDALIEKQQQLIALLKEKRQAVISHAVTKGLDPSAPVKDSGVEWLGKVPAHWSVKQLRHLSQQRGGGTPSKDNIAYWDGKVPWVSPKDMKIDHISDSIDHITERAVAESSTKMIPVGSVLIVVRGMILDHSVPVALTTAPLTLNQDMKALIPGRELEGEFLLFVLKGLRDYLLHHTDSSAHGTKCMNTERLLRTHIALPPAEEQRALISTLKAKLDRLDELSAAAVSARTLLQERRTALISAAVTGKIDVRAWKPPTAHEEQLA